MEKILKNSEEYTNYDFAENWDQIVGLLKNQTFFDKIYEKIVIEYILSIDNVKKRKEFYNKREEILKKRSVSPSLSLSYETYGKVYDAVFYTVEATKDPRINWNDHSYFTTKQTPGCCESTFYDYASRKLFDDFLKSVKILWADNAYLIWHWIPIGVSSHSSFYWDNKELSHFYNEHVGLAIANKLMPDKKWEIVTSQHHKTIVCIEDKLFFDIMMWGECNINTYINNLCFNKNEKYVDNKIIAKKIIDLISGKDYKNSKSLSNAFDDYFDSLDPEIPKVNPETDMKNDSEIDSEDEEVVSEDEEVVSKDDKNDFYHYL